MAFQYDINKIFAELEQQARKKEKKHEVDSAGGSSFAYSGGCRH